MPLCQMNAPVTFQRIVIKIRKRVVFSRAYPDDIIIFPSWKEEHDKEAIEVFTNIGHAEFQVNLKDVHSDTLKYTYSVTLLQPKTYTLTVTK